ncbi:hypothetical protein EI94DRAFT_1800471 [Lactarius quietus]|nr:hypothetical protein EI94DRAFT_1800471 [Lactarius quietus]
MAPRTQRYHPNGDATSARGVGNENEAVFEDSTTPNQSTHSRVPARRVLPETPPQILQPANGKHTFRQVEDSGDAHASSSAMQGNPTKRAWTTGPVCSRPMSLVIPSEDCESYPFSREDVEPKNQQHRDDGVGKGKGKQVQAKLECTLSFYPGYGDNNHPLAQLQSGSCDFHAPKVDDNGYVTDTDFSDDDSTIDVAVRLLTKFLESLEIERPSWAASGSSQPVKHASQSSSASFNDPIPRVKT